jgi:hypothetical protein
MGICVFDAKAIGACARHAIESKEWTMGYETATGRKPAPGLLFVHDQGVYCMSNGRPAQKSATDDSANVAYAEGCDPFSGAPFDEWYGKSRNLVGGDDFVEVFDVDEEFVRACEECDKFCVDVQQDTLRAYLTGGGR